jgi:hypothetical protein
MGRRFATLLLVIVPLAIMAPPALAGGSLLEGPRGVGVGTVVTFRGTFGSGQQAKVSEGPWYGYLTNDSGPNQKLLLGPVQIRRSERFGWVASITFTVPDVRGGDYLVQVCDLACHKGVGDLVGGYVFIGASAEQARFLRKLELVRFRMTRAREDRARLKGTLLEVEAQMASVREDHTSLESQLREVDARAARIATALAVERERANGYLVSSIALGTALLVALITIAWLARRRRRRLPPSREDPAPVRELVLHR